MYIIFTFSKLARLKKKPNQPKTEEQTVPGGDAQPSPIKGKKDPSSKTTDRVSLQNRSLTESGVSQHSH